METRPFQPLYTRSQVGATSSNGTLISSVTLAATGTAQPVTLPGSSGPNTTNQIQIANQSSGWAYVNFGQAGAITAVTAGTGYPIAPGSVAIVTVDLEVSGASCLLDSGKTGNVIFSRGEGI